MPRGWMLLLSAILMVWQPSNFAAEVAATLPSIGMRGFAAVLELMVHGALTALSVAAGWSLWIARPHGPALAAVALIASAATSVQSLYWSVLPTQTIPDDKLPIAILIVVHNATWLAYLARSKRVRQIAS